MKIEKIKSIIPEYSGHSAPSERIILGFKHNEDVYILGTYYDGEYSVVEHLEHLDRTEKMIDEIVEKLGNTIKGRLNQ